MMHAHEVGPVYQIADDYEIHFDPENYLILSMGAKYDQTGSKFIHRNVVASCSRAFNFKQYYRDGRKRWYSVCGVEFHIVVPKHRIELVAEKGYSYVPIIIGGQKITLNVSGGSNGKGGWTDLVRRKVDTCVGMTLKDMRAIADQAYTPEECRTQGITFDLHADEDTQFSTMATSVQLRRLLQPGHQLVLASGWKCAGMTGPFPIASRPNKKREFTCTHDSMKLRIKYQAIDWVATATLNNLPVAEPIAWNKIGNVV
jgi:hypothetical protein